MEDHKYKRIDPAYLKLLIKTGQLTDWTDFYRPELKGEPKSSNPYTEHHSPESQPLWPNHCRMDYGPNTFEFDYASLEKRIIENFNKPYKTHQRFEVQMILFYQNKILGETKEFETPTTINIFAEDIEDAIKKIKDQFSPKEIISIKKETTEKLIGPSILGPQNFFIDIQQDFTPPKKRKFQMNIEFYYNKKSIIHNKTVSVEALNEAEAEFIVKNQYPTTINIISQ